MQSIQIVQTIEEVKSINRLLLKQYKYINTLIMRFCILRNTMAINSKYERCIRIFRRFT